MGLLVCDLCSLHASVRRVSSRWLFTRSRLALFCVVAGAGALGAVAFPEGSGDDALSLCMRVVCWVDVVTFVDYVERSWPAGAVSAARCRVCVKLW